MVNARQIFAYGMISTVLLGLLGGCTFRLPGMGGTAPIGSVPDAAESIPGQLAVRLADASAIETIKAVLGAQVEYMENPLHLARVILPAGMNGTDTITNVENVEGVLYAEPVYLYRRPARPSGGEHIPTAGSRGLVPDDTYFYKQWGPQAINADEIWDGTSLSARVAVVDTGIDLDHTDLPVSPTLTFYAPTGSTNRNDANDGVEGHGSHVAGIIGATRGNATGIAGVAWGVELVPVKVFADNAQGADTIDIANGVTWAVDHGADVINMSLGGKGFSQAMQDAIAYAVEHNVVVVVAMGNDYRRQESSFPAGCQGVIAVGAIGADLKKAAFSNSGRHISVVAPGVTIYSSYLSNGFTYMDGTSMASPHVAGAAAVLRALHPGASPAKIRTVLEQTAQWRAEYGTRPNDLYGWGLIDLQKSVQEFTNHAPAYGGLKITVMHDNAAYTAGAEVVIYDSTGKQITSTRSDQTGSASFPMLRNVPASTGYRVTASANIGGVQHIQTLSSIGVTADSTYATDIVLP